MLSGAGKGRLARAAIWMSTGVLQLVLGTSMAMAESPGCAAVNALNGGATMTTIQQAARFLPGDTVSVTFLDSGLDPRTNPTQSDSVILRAANFSSVAYDYRSFTGTPGPHAGSTPAGYLVANGLYLSVSTRGGYLMNAVVRCENASAAPLALDATTPPAMTVGRNVDQTLAARGGTAPYTFTITAGQLPAGLVLEPAGRVHGVPEQAGGFSATITVADAAGASAHSGYAGSVAAGVPDAPTRVVASAADGEASISFQAPVRTGGAAIARYVVISSGGAQATGSASPITVTGLANGVPVQFRVRADNGTEVSVDSDPSNTVTPQAGQTITFPAPGAQPVGTLLPLDAAASSGLPVQYSSQTPQVCVIEAPANVRLQAVGTCSVRAGQPGNSSINAAAPVDRSFQVVAAQASAPTLQRAERVGATSVDVFFDPPLSTGGSAIEAYEVITLPGASVVTGASSPVRVNRLQAGRTYTFHVRARTAAGPGAMSAPSNPVTLPTVPRITAVDVPAVGRYLAGEVLHFSVQFDQAVRVTGAPQLMLTIGSQRVGAGYLSGSGSPVLAFGYTVRPGELDTDGIGIVGLELAGATLRNADDVDALLALSNVGATQGVTVGAQLAGAPTLRAAVAGDGEATLTFDAPADSGGTAVLDYAITQYPGGVVHAAARSPATVTGLVNGTAYSFTVAARTAAGTGSPSARSMDVVPRASQQIQFAAPGPQRFGSTPRLSIQASSGLPVQVASTTPTVCSIAPDGQLTLLAAGTCSIDADQPGTEAVLPAARVSRSFAVVAVEPGGAVINSVVLVASDTAEVSFSAPVFDGGSPVTGYLLQAVPGGQSVRGSGSPLRISGLPTGIAQRFTVTAINSVGSGPVSAPSDALTVLDAPRVLRVGVPAAGRYLPGQALELEVYFDQPLQVATPPVLQLAVGTLRRAAALQGQRAGAQGTVLRFAYTVLAEDRDEDGIEVESLQAAAGSLRNAQGTAAAATLHEVESARDVLVGGERPGAPTDATGVAADGQVQVHFVAPLRSGSAPVLDYTVIAQPGGMTATGTTSPITVSGLANGTPYRFVVVARSLYGQGAASSASAPVTPLPPLGTADTQVTLGYGAAATPLALSITGSATRVDITRTAQHGTLEVQGTRVLYTPHAGYAGPDSVGYTVSDAFSTSAPAVVNITVGAATVTIDAPALAEATAGSAYSARLVSRGGLAPYAYALVSGALPAGLSLDAAGLLSGVPSVAGRFTFEVDARDSSTGTGPFQARRSMVLVVAAPGIEKVEDALPVATQAGEIRLQLQARGGTAPYAFRLLAGALPPGVLLARDGRVEGSPGQAGTFDFEVEVSDAYGFTGTARYQLQVAQAAQAITGFIADPGAPVFSEGGSFRLAAQGGASGQPLRFASSTPAVCSVSGDRVVMLAAGNCSLTADQAGDANHTAAAQQRLEIVIAAATPVLTWSADLQRVLEQGSFELPLPVSASAGSFRFESSTPAVATLDGRTVQVHAAGTTLITAHQSAAGSFAAASVTLQLSITVRPDPTRDPGVSGLLQAQVDASVRFANAQQANIRDRLRQVRDGGNGASNTLSFSNGGRSPGAASLPLGQTLGTGAGRLPPGWGSWAAGTATYGRGGSAGAGRYDLRSDGLSVGVDRALGTHGVIGLAGSVGRNDSEQDDPRTGMRADQRSLSLYGLWRANAHVYVDALVAAGTLQFDLRRWNSDAQAQALAQRDGTQWFGSVALGYEQRVAGMRVSGYARLDSSRSTLDGYRERGLDALDLSYGRQVVDDRALALGLDGSAEPAGDARLRPFWSVEYRQALQDRGQATVNYAQWSRPQDYTLALRSYNDDLLSLAAGVDVAMQRGWILSLLFGHEQARGGDRSSSLGLRLSSGGGQGGQGGNAVP